MLSPKSIANYFLDLARKNGDPISPMKLQKLVYYAHGWYAGYTQQPLINEEIEAWQYGPVIPSLYYEFKPYGASAIKGKASDWEGNRFSEVPTPSDLNIRSFLDNVWNSYSKYTGIALSEMTHAKDSPWHKTWEKCQGVKNTDIPFDVIRAHFAEAAARAQPQPDKTS
jgi:uncharacterized phage-associated protein